jgi:hypothetical protein
MTGFLVGVGATAVSLYLYKKNQPQIDDFLRRQGIELPSLDGKDPGAMSLEDLVAEKERLEDVIAEREMEPGEPPSDAEPAAG